MSIDKRLEHELAINHSDEQERIENIESERRAQFEILRKSYQIVSSKSSREPNLNYLMRDQAFFKIIHSTQRLQSKLTMLSQFDQPVVLPNISARDAKITSVLECYDPEKTTFLVDFESFITDRDRHNKRILSINTSIRNIHDDIRNNTVPALLFFLLEWIPFIFQIYQYFSPENPVNTYIRKGEAFIQELDNLEKELIKEDTVYYARWQEKFKEYYALSMNPKKMAQYRKAHEDYTQLLQAQEDLKNLIFKTKKIAPLKEAYDQFKLQPSYVTLLQLCTQLCQLKQTLQSRNQDISRVDRALHTLGELYPEVKPYLQKYVQETLKNIADRDVFTLLGDNLVQNINSNREQYSKIREAEQRMSQISKDVATLKPSKENKQRLIAANDNIQEMHIYIEKAKQEMEHRRKLIVPLKAFIQHRTAENLKELYQYTTTTDNADHREYTEILRSIYPATIDALEAESQEIILRLNDSTFQHLRNLFQNSIDQIGRSNSKMREIAQVFKSLLSSPDWTWGQFSDLEKAIERNPDYIQNQDLAALMNQITQTVIGAQQFREPIQRKPAEKKTSSTQPEIVIPHNATAPTFFHPAARHESEFTQAVKEKMRGHKNAYSINSTWDKITSAQKQEAINTMVDHMLQYITIVSDDDRVQTIGGTHLAVLAEIGAFIKQMTAPEYHHLMNEVEFQRVATLLEKLDTTHPIREHTQFLIDVFRTKDEYAAIDTRYVQDQLRKDLEEEIQSQAKQLEKKQKSQKHNPRSMEATINSAHWSAVLGFKKLIQAYKAKLQQNPSASNQDEMNLLTEISSKSERIYNMVRNEQKTNTQQIESILDNLNEYAKNLGDGHVIKAVLNQFVGSLQATTEYSKFSVSTQESALKKNS